MMKWRLLALLTGLLLAISSQAQIRQYLSLKKDFASGRIHNWRCNTTLDGSVLRVDFLNTATYPTLTVNRPSVSDWSTYDAFLITVENLESYPVAIYLRIDDDQNATGLLHSRTGYALLDSFQTRTFAFPLRINPAAFGMKGVPGIVGSTWMAMNNSVLDISHVVKWNIYQQNPSSSRSIRLSNSALATVNLDLTGIVDQFGQYSGAEFANKVHSEDDIVAQEQLEQADLDQHPGPTDQDLLGGFRNGVQVEGTGRFRTAKFGRNWWMISPYGVPFLSFGMNTVSSGDSTILLHRENMFSWLPGSGDSLAQFFGLISNWVSNPPEDGPTYGFYRANLYRKYGDDFQQISDDRAHKRLRSWGFNTLGNWTQDRLWAQHRTPYTVGVDIKGRHATLNVDPNRAAMPDPYDPLFATDVQTAIQGEASFVAEDPYCVGWFIDNEPTLAGGTEENGRYGIAYAAMRKNLWESPAKIELISELQARYPSIQLLNLSWGTSFASWEDMFPPVSLTENSTLGRKADFQTFCRSFLKQYFATMRNKLRAFDPTVMFLGCRFFRYTPEALDAAAGCCDVISFNVYAHSLNANWANYGYLGKPLMVSEFHFGTIDSGLFHPGLVAVANLQARGDSFTTYVNSVVDNPLFVGCHWHQYIDEPLTGRVVDGENYNEGFVSVADDPYDALVNAARTTLYGAYARRWQGN